MAMLVWGVACASDGEERGEVDYVQPGQSSMEVEEFEIEGTDHIELDELKEGLATKEDPGWRADSWISWFPVLGAEHEYFNSVQWERDKERILTYYKARGYFDASLTNIRLQKDPEEGVRLYVKVEEGEPTRVKLIELEGLGTGSPISEEELLKDLPIELDGVFDQTDYVQAKETIARRLKNKSFAYAKVDGRVIVRPKSHAAEILFFVDSGPKAVFGEIDLRGLNEVDRTYVEEAISFTPGEPYSDAKLQQTQESIYDLGVFSLVTVQPAFELKDDPGSPAPEQQGEGEDVRLATPEDPEPTENLGASAELIDSSEVQDAADAPGALGISDILGAAQEAAQERDDLPQSVRIAVILKEAKNWSIRVGGGFSITSTRQDVHLALNLSSRNFLGTLGKLDQFNTVGYATTPGIFSANSGDALSLDGESNRGIFFESLARYSQPQFLERKTTGFLQVSVERDIQENYIALTPAGSLGLRRPIFFRNLSLEVSYNILYLYYQQFNDDFAQQLRAQGIDTRQGNRSLLIEYLEQRLIYDGRDNPLNPTKGVRVQLSMQEATDYAFGGDYTYLRPTFRFDAYYPYSFLTKWVSAIRGSLGSVYNFNTVDGATGVADENPLQSRYFGGGRGSIRSFGSRYFGFFTQDTENPGPIGSNTLLDFSIEQRFRLVRKLLGVGDFWGAAFADAGSFTDRHLIWDTEANSRGTSSFGDLTSNLIWGAGGGIYWLTPIGPVRFDLAFTLTDISEDPRFGARDPNPDISSDPVEQQRYADDVARAIQDRILGYDFFIGIGHSF